MIKRKLKKIIRQRKKERKKKRKLRVKKRNSCAEGSREGKIATVEWGNISERLSIAAFYAN